MASEPTNFPGHLRAAEAVLLLYKDPYQVLARRDKYVILGIKEAPIHRFLGLY